MEDQLKNFYQKNLSEHGHSAQGVGWKNHQAQEIRFKQLLKVITVSRCSINDLGCGTGDFVGFAGDKISDWIYRGYDVMEDMISLAKKRYDSFGNASFHLIKGPEEMQMAHYTIASGIFNIRFAVDDESWRAYILDTLRLMDARSTAGFAFNILTRYSDREFMKPELYYEDPCFLFDFCKRTFAKNVALLHDYDQYDFTVIVRKENKI